MKKNIKLLFEYQKFDQNEHLNRIIIETQSDAPIFVAEEALTAVVGGKTEEEDKENKEITK